MNNILKPGEKITIKSIRNFRANTLSKPFNKYKMKEDKKVGKNVTPLKFSKINTSKNKINENSKINNHNLFQDKEWYDYHNKMLRQTITNNIYNKNQNAINKNVPDSKKGSLLKNNVKIKTTKLIVDSKNKNNNNTSKINIKKENMEKEKKIYKKREPLLLGKKIKRENPGNNQTNKIITIDNEQYYLIKIDESFKSKVKIIENILKVNNQSIYQKRKILNKNENIQKNKEDNIVISQDIKKTNEKEQLMEINHQESISINNISQKIGQIEKNKILTINKNIIQMDYQGYNIMENYKKKLKFQTEIKLNLISICNNKNKTNEIENIVNNENNMSDNEKIELSKANTSHLNKKVELPELIEKKNGLENKVNSFKIEENINNNLYINKKLLESKKDFIVYEKHKIYGFSNILNNCYLNSSLQLLTRIDEFKKYILNFKEIQTENNETKGNLILEFKKMLNLIESSNNKNLIIDPSKLKRVMGCVDERYFEDHQEDSNEFISNFIDALLWETANTNQVEENIKKLHFVDEDEKNAYTSFYKKFYKRRGYSFILDLFYGINKTNKLCKACNKIFTIKFNSFNMIELPIFELANKTKNNYLTFDEIINKYLGYNKIKSICKYCKNEEEIYSKISLYTLPKYLIISFGRAINDKYVYTDIKYKDTLKIKSDFDKSEYNYKLECVIQHSGGANSGHYTALCPKDTSNKIWYNYSDEYCNEDDTNTNYQSKIAIILLYKKI